MAVGGGSAAGESEVTTIDGGTVDVGSADHETEPVVEGKMDAVRVGPADGIATGEGGGGATLGGRAEGIVSDDGSRVVVRVMGAFGRGLSLCGSNVGFAMGVVGHGPKVTVTGAGDDVGISVGTSVPLTGGFFGGGGTFGLILNWL